MKRIKSKNKRKVATKSFINIKAVILITAALVFVFVFAGLSSVLRLFGEPADAEAYMETLPSGESGFLQSSPEPGVANGDTDMDGIPDDGEIAASDDDGYKGIIKDNQKYFEGLVEEDSRNVLLIGQDVVYGNFDTLMIVSISKKDKSIRLINFPRDIYIDYRQMILDRLKEASPEFYLEPGNRKLNAVYVVGRKIGYKDGEAVYGDNGNSGNDGIGKTGNALVAGSVDVGISGSRSPYYNIEGGLSRFKDGSMNFLCDIIYEIFDIKVDDYIRLKTDGLRNIIDYFGGVEILVPYLMNYDDLAQELHIHLEQGLQVLNGEQAEGFLRFRQGYDADGNPISYSDYERKQNQNKFMQAFFKQHMTLENLAKLGEISDLIMKNMRSSITAWEAITSYSGVLVKSLDSGYLQKTIIVDCPRNKTIDGSSYEMIRTTE